MKDTFLQLIKSARFPLICLVVLAHSSLSSFDPVYFYNFSTGNIYNFITQGLSHNYTKIAVCCFFLFSGYLFFRGINSFSWSVFTQKWKNRIHTLLIPFICWNLIMVAAISTKNFIFGLFGHYSAEEMGPISLNHILDWFRAPIDFPLWFMEDLIFMVLITPALYLAIKKSPRWSLLVLLLIYASPLNPTHISMRAIFFFSLGAWCSITGFDILGFCRKYKVQSHILAAVTLLPAIFTNSMTCHEWTLRLFFPFGIMSFFNIIDSLTQGNAARTEKLQALSGSVFFIYAAHEIYILGWTKGVCLRLFGESLPAMYLRYFIVPALVLVICYVLYRIFNKFTPKTLSFLCGGR